MQLTDEQFADWIDLQRTNMSELLEINRQAAKDASVVSIMNDAYFMRVAAIEYAASKGYTVRDAVDAAKSLLTELKYRGY